MSHEQDKRQALETLKRVGHVTEERRWELFRAAFAALVSHPGESAMSSTAAAIGASEYTLAAEAAFDALASGERAMFSHSYAGIQTEMVCVYCGKQNETVFCEVGKAEYAQKKQP